MQKKRIIAIILAVVMLVTTANFMPKYVKAEEAEELSDEDTQDIASDTDAEAYAGNDTANGLAGAVQDDIQVVQAVTGKITGTIGGLTGSAYQIDGTTTGYCLQHSKSNYFSDVGGSYVYGTEYWADITNKRITTTLYVGSIKQDLYSGWNGLTSEQRAAMTALACSYYNGDSQDIIYANQLMHDFIDHMTALTAQNVIPYYSDTERYSISASTIKANAQSDGTYYTDSFRLVKTLQQSDDSNTRISWQMTVPADATYTVRMYNNTSGTGSYTSYTAGQTLTANENNSFRVFSNSPFSTSTLSFSSPNGAYNTAVYTPTNSSYQAVGYCCTLVNNKTLNITLTSDQLGAVAISKSSANPAVTAGSTCYSLQGAVYKMYRSVSDAQSNSNVVATLITDENGYAMASDIPLGSYVIKETQPPEGYALDSNIYSVTITANHTTTAPCILNVTDRPQMDPTRVLLTKQNENGQALEGAEFTFKYYAEQSDTDPATMGKSPVRTWVFKTDEYGKINMDSRYKVSGDEFYYNSLGIIMLPCGTVTIQETKAPYGYIIDDTVFVRQIKSDGTTSEAVITYNAPILTNKEFRAYLKIIKKDADTGKSLLNNAATFKIWSYEANEYVDFNGISEFNTNDRGELITPDSLPVGRYRIDEYMSPDGYYISEPNKKYDIDVSTSGNYTKYIDENGTVTDMGLFTIEVDNTSVKGYIEIEKSGESYGAYDYNKGKYEISDVALSNVSFKIYANDNIYSTDGHKNLIYSKNELVDVIVTDENGYAISKEIPLGKYIIREDTPSGYVSIPDMEVELSTSSELRDETINSTYHKAYYERVDIANILQKAKISVYKYDENKIYSLAGAEFALYEYNEEYTDRESYINSGIKVASGKTDENGKLYFGIFPLGRYVIVETKSPAGYSLSTDISIINAEYDVSAVEYVDITDTWINNVAQGSVKLLKRDLENHDLALKGVKFNLYRRNDDNAANIADIADMIANEQAFDSKTREVINSFKDSADDIFVGEYTTDEDGEINISELPIGEYYFRETEAYSSKYWRTEDVIAFGVEEGKTTTVMVFNDGRVGTLILKGVAMPGSGGGHYVKTGDNFTKNMLLLFLVSGVGVAFFVSKRKEDD